MKKQSSIQTIDTDHCSSLSGGVSNNHVDETSTSSSTTKSRTRRNIRNYESQDIPIPNLYKNMNNNNNNRNNNNQNNNNIWNKLNQMTAIKVNPSSSYNQVMLSCFYPVHDAIMTSSDSIIKSSSPKLYIPGISSDREIIDDVIPSLVSDLTYPKSRTSALRCLCHFTDQNHQYNRVPIVTSTQYNILHQLSTYCFELEDDNDNNNNNNNDNNYHINCYSRNKNSYKKARISWNENRKHALLLFNHLCIPIDNKSIILYGDNESSELILSSIVTMIYYGVPESYISIIILLNLSLHNDTESIKRIMSYIPSHKPKRKKMINHHDNNNNNHRNNSHNEHDAPSMYQYKIPMDDEWSLLRIIENRLQEYTSCLKLYYDINQNTIVRNNNDDDVVLLKHDQQRHQKESQDQQKQQQHQHDRNNNTTIEIEFIRWSLNLFCSLIRKDSYHTSIICNKTIIIQLAGYCLKLSVEKNQIHKNSNVNIQVDDNDNNDNNNNNKRRNNNTSLQQQQQETDNNTNKELMYGIDFTSWMIDSIEDSSLMLLLYSATYDDCIESLCSIPYLKDTLNTIVQSNNNDRQNNDKNSNNSKRKTKNNDMTKRNNIHKVRAEALYERLFLED